MTRFLLLCWVTSMCVPALAAEQSTLDPDAPYQAVRSNPVTYKVDFRVVVTAPYKTKVLKVWLPLAQSDYGHEVTEGAFTPFPRQATWPYEDKTLSCA
ncbi:MAG: hypothetical protein WHT09_16580 [Thermogutta sp.]|jgi:hypothetical protein